MFAEHKVSPLPQEVWGTGSDNYTIFRQRRAAMMEMFTWDLPYLRKQCADMNWDIALHPKIRQRAQWASSAAILASSKTRYPEQVWALCREFLSPEFQLRANQRGGLPPSRAVARQLVARNDTQPKNLAALITAADFLHPNPRVASKMEIQQQFSSACDAVWMNRMTPEQAMARAEREINRVIEKSRK
jgi:ABC-type glycerol-3-phosphate transport system substrate-binding protein